MADSLIHPQRAPSLSAAGATGPLPRSPHGGSRGRVNGSLSAAGGRVNGSQLAPRRGSTNGRGPTSRVRTRGARPRSYGRLAAVTAAVAILLPSLWVVGLGAHAPAFSVDGQFGDWQSVAAFRDLDSTAAAGPDLQAVRVAVDARTLFVEVEAASALFAPGAPAALRIFVDSDGDLGTGFDLGEVGADLMVEAVGEADARVGAGYFAFDHGRDPSDWNGWQRLGPASMAVDGHRLEAAIPGIFTANPAVTVALSAGGAEDLLDAPAAPRGTLIVNQAAGESRVIAEGSAATALVDLAFELRGGAATVSSLDFAPAGAADFSVIEGARLVLEAGREVVAREVRDSGLSFSFDPPLAISAEAVVRATLLADLAPGRIAAGVAGSSFGARVAAVGYEPGEQFLVVRPRALAPSAYLSFVGAAPVIDGAFGEWALAGAASDPTDIASLPGADLVGIRAMTHGGSGAFFAEARGPILGGARPSELPRHTEAPAAAAPAPAPSPAAPAGPPVPFVPPPVLSVDDRFLVYLDTDSDPNTGFRPAANVPIGAEFVVEVAGRFSWAARAHLLAFAGTSPLESRWTVRGALDAAVVGAALEGELPEPVFAATGGARLFFQTVDWTGRTGDLSDPLQDARLGGANADDLLHFRAVTFDPLRGPPPVAESLRLAAPDGYFVVQLKASPTDAVLGALESAGATLYGYVHSNAYLAAMDNAQAAVVRAMPEVRWVGAYEPAFKFPGDPASWGEGPLTLLALLFTRPRDLDAQVQAAGGTVLSSTDISMRVSINGSQLAALARIPSVQFIDRENQRVPLNDVGRALQGVNLTFSRHGLDGSHIVVGITDSGVDFTHPAFDDSGNASTGPLFDGRIVAYFKYSAAYGDSDGHGTHTAGSIAGDGDLSNTTTPAGAAGQFRGVAPAASLAVIEIFGASPPSDDEVFADQESAGATVSSNSWGYVDAQQHGVTDYDVAAYLTDQSVIDSNTSRSGLQPMTIVFAAGNDGSQGANSVGTPGTGKNIITVGASETNRGYDDYADDTTDIAVFSSLGPTDDGRIKPDVVAVGTYVASTQSRTSGCSCTFGGWDLGWTGSNYALLGGTSQATPQVAGIAALIQQHINDTLGRIPSPALVKASMINGAEDLGYGYEFTGGSTGPMRQGWGRVNVSRSIDGPPDGTILLFDEGPSLGGGDVAVRRFTVASSGTPLKATVVWTDQPGNPQDTKSLSELVNDLDLTVRAPNGTVYHGNKFQGGWSRPNNTTYDHLNNTENVFVQSPSTGVWTVEVSGYSVKSASQKFAMAISGNLTEKAPPSVADVHAVPGAPANGKFGWNATAVCSINGDAYADLVVGAPGAQGGNGSVYIFFGGVSESFASINVSLADVTLTGTAGESFGSAVDSAGDFNGDGTADLLIGAPGSGKAYLYHGTGSWASPSPAVTFTGSAAERFGSAVLLSPLDNRSGAEAVVGAPLNSTQKGAVFLFGGTPPGSTWQSSAANRTFQGVANGSRLGTSLAAGDADGDGSADLAVGAPGASLVRLVKGGFGLAALAINATVTGIPGTAFGQSVAMAGDVNGDSKDDLVVGAPMANDSAGAAYVFLGASPIVDDQVIRYYFFDDMESGVSKWQEMSGESNASSPWSLSSSTFYGTSVTGNSWQDSSGSYAVDADASIATASGINLASATNPVLTFYYRADLEEVASNYDGFLVKYSVNSGNTWVQLNANNSEGNYDAIGYDPTGPPADNSPITDLYAFTYDRFVWRKVSFNLTPLAGNSSVTLRFQFGSDPAIVSDGVYLDDIAVLEARPSSPDLTLYGESYGDLFGFTVAAVGDLNGDGPADFAVGAPLASPGGLPSAGQAFVFTGSTTLDGTNTSGNAAEILAGSSAGANLGWSLVPLTGFNSSSSTFLLAGTPGAGGGSGGASIGNATSPIPEFGEMATACAMAGLAALALRRRRRQA